MMVKSNELRIGNWIEFADGKFIEVDIHILSVICEYQTYVIDITYPKPIPLEPEILEKAGFVLESESHVKFNFNGEIGRIDRIYSQKHFPSEDENNVRIECVLDPKNLSVRRIGIRGFNYSGMRGLRNSPMDIKYLHTLQNLYFSLTGEDLKIDL
jgi:hypothetical protein